MAQIIENQSKTFSIVIIRTLVNRLSFYYNIKCPVLWQVLQLIEVDALLPINRPLENVVERTKSSIEQMQSFEKKIIQGRPPSYSYKEAKAKLLEGDCQRFSSSESETGSFSWHNGSSSLKQGNRKGLESSILQLKCAIVFGLVDTVYVVVAIHNTFGGHDIMHHLHFNELKIRIINSRIIIISFRLLQLPRAGLPYFACCRCPPSTGTDQGFQH